MQSLQIFSGSAERQQDSQLFICQEAGEHHTDSREKLSYMLGGRRRCSEKEACKHGVSFHFCHQYQQVCTVKNYETEISFPSLMTHTWEQSHRNRTGKELRSAGSFSSCQNTGVTNLPQACYHLRLQVGNSYRLSKCFILKPYKCFCLTQIVIAVTQDSEDFHLQCGFPKCYFLHCAACQQKSISAVSWGILTAAVTFLGQAGRMKTAPAKSLSKVMDYLTSWDLKFSWACPSVHALLPAQKEVL